MRPKFAHLQPPVNPFFKDFSFLNERISFGKPDPHRYFVDGVVDVKGSWTSQSPLPPTKAGLPARSCSPETEALGATFRIVQRQTERTLLASIALPSDRVFLTKTRRRRSSSPKLSPRFTPVLTFTSKSTHLPYKDTVPGRCNRKSRDRTAWCRPRCNRKVDTWGNRSTLSRISRT